MQIIVYKQDDGKLAVIYPSAEALALHGIDAIARKDVPHGKPYKIIDHADLPASRTDRDRWTIDPALLTDGVGAASNEFEVQP